MKIFKKAIVLAALFTALPVLAHSTVSPSQTATSKYETFTLGVPTEKEMPTTSLRLAVPPELDRVMPFVKPGWKIAIKKDEAGKVTEIEWTDGNIPAGQKDVFQFTARTPEADVTLVWKAYQTYQGGEVVAWDQDPNAKPEKEGEHVANLYSTTVVKGDLGAVAQTAAVTATSTGSSLPLILSIVALAISLISLFKKK